MPSRILAWDTSRNTGILSAFVHEGSGAQPSLLHSALLDVDQKQHSEGLFLGIEMALQQIGWSWDKVQAIGIGAGPGSFTGVRVGMTAARTFGQMLGIPLIPVSSLAVSVRLARKQWPGDAEPLLLREACMGEVYARHGLNQAVVRLVELGTWLSKTLSGQVRGLPVLADQRLWLHPVMEELSRSQGWIPRMEQELPQDAASWALALASECQASAPVPALEVTPVYLRAPDAELKLKAKLANLG